MPLPAGTIGHGVISGAALTRVAKPRLNGSAGDWFGLSAGRVFVRQKVDKEAVFMACRHLANDHLDLRFIA